MAAYGLYTHIASNKFRSMLLLAGLFVLVYVMVYAGALIAEVVINSGAPVDYYLAAAARDLITAFPYATGGAALWIVIAYFFHQIDHRRRDRRRGRDAAAAAPALQSAGKSLHLARHPDAEAEDHATATR